MPPDNITPDLDATKASVEAFKELNGILGSVGTVIQNLTTQMTQFSGSLKDMVKFNQDAINSFGLMANGLVGVRDSFNSLSNIDTRGILTFRGQIDSLFTLLENKGTAPGLMKQGFSLLSDSLIRLGAPADTVKNKMGEGLGALKSYAQQFITSADNGVKLQNALIQLASQTGELGIVYQSAGTDLEHMNDLLAKQANFLGNASRQTGLSGATIEQYYNQLATIPKVLEETSFQMSGSGETMNKLTATIQLATGAGRKYEDVIADIKKATIDYGLSFNQALQFTARIGEISNKFQIPIKNVEAALTDNIDKFKMFADAGTSAAKQFEGFSQIINNYTDALKQTGMSSADAISTVHTMTNAISGLRIEQKAFLSQQTGGPGGLVGGFQIEKMLREGRTAEVFDKVREALQKQFGQIATLDEASRSPEAANRLMKQSLILQQGPLGQFAQTPQQAYRILEAFRARQEGKIGVEQLDPNIIQSQIDRGKKVEQLSQTPLSNFATMLESVRYTANIANFSELQKYFTARSGTPTTEFGESAEMGEFRRNAQRMPIYRETNKLGEAAAGTTKDALQLDFINWAKTIPSHFKTIFEPLVKATQGGNTTEANKALETLKSELQANKNTKDYQQAMDLINKMPGLKEKLETKTTASPPISLEQLKKDIYGTTNLDMGTKLNDYQKAINEGKGKEASNILSGIRENLNQTVREHLGTADSQETLAKVRNTHQELSQYVSQISGISERGKMENTPSTLLTSVAEHNIKTPTHIDVDRDETSDLGTMAPKAGSLGVISVTVNTKCDQCNKSVIGPAAASASPHIIDVTDPRPYRHQ